MSLPANVHVSEHPVIKTKISQIRQALSAKDTRQLSTEIASLMAAWVSNDAFSVTDGEKVCTFYQYFDKTSN